jgi:hypothetical protein
MTRLISKLSGTIVASALLFTATGFTSANATTITAAIGATSGNSAAWAFVGGSDGNVWLNTNYGGAYHWQNLTPLTVAYGAGVLSPGGNPNAYAVATDGNLYSITDSGGSWTTVNLGTPSGVTLVSWVGSIQNSSNQPFIFFVGSDGNLWLKHNAGTWQAWKNLGNPGSPVVVGVGATNITPSYPQIFVKTSSGQVYQSTYNGSGYVWRLTPIACGLCLVTAENSDTLPAVFNASGRYLASGTTYTFSYYSNPLPTGGAGMAVGIAIQDNWPVFTDTTQSYLYFGGPPGTTWYQTDFAASTGTTVAVPVGVEDPGSGLPYAFVIGADGNLYVAGAGGTPSNLGMP